MQQRLKMTPFIYQVKRLLGIKTHNEALISQALMDLAKYKLEIAKILENINDANNKNRLKMQKENNLHLRRLLFGGGGLLTVLGTIVTVVLTGERE